MTLVQKLHYYSDHDKEFAMVIAITSIGSSNRGAIWPLLD